MSQRSVRDLSDVAALTPGLNFEAYLGGSGTPVIRGAAQSRITDLDQNVSVFFDNVYLPRQYAVSPGVIGLERVEIVKGPQSALYGRNAFSGAINYVAKKPGDRFQASAEGTVGGDARYDVLADISGPLVAAKLFARIGVGYSTFDGDAHNDHPNAGVHIPGGSSGKLGGWDDRSYQARLVWQPTENLELDAGYYHFRILTETPAIVRVQQSTNDTNCGATLAGGRKALYCGELRTAFSPLAGDTIKGDTVVDPRGIGLSLTSNIGHASVSWKPTDTLRIVYEYGKLTARGISGGGSDRDPILGSVNPFNPAVRGNQWQVSPVTDDIYHQNELRVEWAVTPGLDLMLGAFKSQLTDFDQFPLSFGIPLLGTTAPNIFGPGFLNLVAARTTVDAKAVFGRVNWRITDRLRLGVEARYAKEDKTAVNGPTAFVPAVTTLNGSWSQTTPRVSLDYKLTPRNMVYVTAAKGAKSGGFNTNSFVASQRSFEQDTNWTYELGSKNEFMHGTLRFNAALFFIDWSNQQVNCSALGAPPGVTVPVLICNLGKASVKGAEFDTTYAPVEQFTAALGVSYNDATYGSGVVDQQLANFRYCDGVVCPANGAIGGKQLLRQSKVQASLDAEYRWPLGSMLKAYFGGDVTYKSKQYADDQILAYLPARSLTTLRAGVRGDAWDAYLWAKNVFDLNYAASSYAIVAATDVQYVPIRGPQRTFGLTARYRF